MNRLPSQDGPKQWAVVATWTPREPHKPAGSLAIVVSAPNSNRALELAYEQHPEFWPEHREETGVMRTTACYPAEITEGSR